MATTFTMTLILDELDYQVIQKEIAHRQVSARNLGSTAKKLLPDGDSSFMGAMLAEIVRDLVEYRSLWNAEHKPEENNDT